MSPISQYANFGISYTRIPVNKSVLQEWHLMLSGLLHDFRSERLLLVSGIAVPDSEVHCLPATVNVPLHQPGYWRQVAIKMRFGLYRVTVCTLGSENRANIGGNFRTFHFWG